MPYSDFHIVLKNYSGVTATLALQKNPAGAAFAF